MTDDTDNDNSGDNTGGSGNTSSYGEDRKFQLSSQIALWGARALTNLSKSSTLKSRFLELGARELVGSMAVRYSSEKTVGEWLAIAREALN